MRRGRLFKRCTKCHRRVTNKRCPGCGLDSFSWAFVVDVALAGAKRDQRMRSGFNTKAAAIEAMNRLQQEKAEGTHVETSKLTLGGYLDQWWATGSIRSWSENTKRDYRVAIQNHIEPKLGHVSLQALTSSDVSAIVRLPAHEGAGHEDGAEHPHLPPGGAQRCGAREPSATAEESSVGLLHLLAHQGATGATDLVGE